MQHLLGLHDESLARATLAPPLKTYTAETIGTPQNAKVSFSAREVIRRASEFV